MLGFAVATEGGGARSRAKPAGRLTNRFRSPAVHIDRGGLTSNSSITRRTRTPEYKQLQHPENGGRFQTTAWAGFNNQQGGGYGGMGGGLWRLGGYAAAYGGGYES